MTNSIEQLFFKKGVNFSKKKQENKFLK